MTEVQEVPVLVSSSQKEQVNGGYSTAELPLAVGIEFLHYVLGEMSQLILGQFAQSFGLGLEGLDGEAVSGSVPRGADGGSVHIALQLRDQLLKYEVSWFL